MKKDESWTKGLSLTETPAIPHNHEADFIDAETKGICSAAFTFLCGEIPLELGLDDFLAYFSSTHGCKDLPLEGVHVSLLSHGMFWTRLHATSTERTTTLKLGTSSLLCRLDMLIQQSGIYWLQSTLNSPLLTRSSFSKAMETSLPEERNAM